MKLIFKKDVYFTITKSWEDKMTKQNDVFKCSICGNTVVMVHPGIGEKVCQNKVSDDKEYFECVLNAGQLNCCGKLMDLSHPKESDTGHEKHKPVLEKAKNNITIQVGSIPHPMEEAHWIEWIEVLTSDDRSYRKYLKPGSAPEAKFENIQDVNQVRAYCNIHGLWESIIK